MDDWYREKNAGHTLEQVRAEANAEDNNKHYCCSTESTARICHMHVHTTLPAAAVGALCQTQLEQ